MATTTETRQLTTISIDSLLPERDLVSKEKMRQIGKILSEGGTWGVYDTRTMALDRHSNDRSAAKSEVCRFLSSVYSKMKAFGTRNGDLLIVAGDPKMKMLSNPLAGYVFASPATHKLIGYKD